MTFENTFELDSDIVHYKMYIVMYKRLWQGHSQTNLTKESKSYTGDTIETLEVYFIQCKFAPFKESFCYTSVLERRGKIRF